MISSAENANSFMRMTGKIKLEMTSVQVLTRREKVLCPSPVDGGKRDDIDDVCKWNLYSLSDL